MTTPPKFLNPLTLTAGALAVLAVNLWIVGPFLSENAGNGIGNLLYIVTRVVVLVGYSFAMTRYLGKKRVQAISSTTLLAFLDQTVLKLAFMVYDFKLHPVSWEGITPQMAFFGLVGSYLVYFPIVFLLAFLGTELSKLAFFNPKWS